jgi:hypothetical protein
VNVGKGVERGYEERKMDKTAATATISGTIPPSGKPNGRETYSCFSSVIYSRGKNFPKQNKFD